MHPTLAYHLANVLIDDRLRAAAPKGNRVEAMRRASERHTYSVPVVRENLPPARISQRALVLASLVAGERPVREA